MLLASYTEYKTNDIEVNKQSPLLVACYYKFLFISSRIFENVTAKSTSSVKQLIFWPKTPPSPKWPPIFFFSLLLPSSSSLFLFLFSFSLAGVIFEIVGCKKPDFCLFFTQMAARFVFKKSVRFRDFCETVFRGVLFPRLQQANIKKRHQISRFKRSQLYFTFQN